MNDDYDKIEEELKKKKEMEKKKEIKVSGRSVFVTQEIIKKKGEVQKEENADSGEAVARDS